MAGYRVVLRVGLFKQTNKKTGKTQKVVEDYNNGNNVFLFVFYIDYLHKKDRKKPT
jgi:hypothetical protein